MQELLGMSLHLAVRNVPQVETQAVGCSALLQTCEAAVKQQLRLPADTLPQLASLLTPALRPAVRHVA